MSDNIVLRAVAEVMIEERKTRAAADEGIAADLVAIRDVVDAYGNVLKRRFAELDTVTRHHVAEQAIRSFTDRELAGDLGRLRERVDEYGNVIETRFLALEHRARDMIETAILELDVQDGAPGAPGERGERGEAGPMGLSIQGEQGPPGPAGYVGQARGRWNAEAEYRALDVVACNGSEWRAIRDDPGPLPGDGWMLGAKGVKGEKGERGAGGARGEKGERGERGGVGPPGPQGVGILDITIDGGVLVIALTNGQHREFMLEAAT